MKKHGLWGGIVLISLLAAFNAVAFAVPHTFGPAYWLGYAFTTLAILSQAVFALLAFQSASGAEKVFYGLPVFRTGILYLIVQTVFGLLCLFVPAMPAWAAGAVSVLILAVCVILAASAMKSRELAEKAGEGVRGRTEFMKALENDTAALFSSAKNEEIKAEAKKIYEAVRYSDPLSASALAGAEEKLSSAFSTLSRLAAADDALAFHTAATEFLLLLEERNAQCKRLKQPQNI